MTYRNGQPHGTGVYGRGAIILNERGEQIATWNVPKRTPCRVDRSKGLRQHRCSGHHASVVEGYRAWRDSALAAAEDATNGYQTELDEYWLTHERPTLKAYLIGYKDNRDN